MDKLFVAGGLIVFVGILAPGMLESYARGTDSYKRLTYELQETKAELSKLQILYDGYQDGVKDSQ